MMNDSPSNFRKKIHVPMTDIDDIPFNKQDPKFVAQMTNMMQVPASITLNNGHSNHSSRNQSFYSNPADNIQYQMDIPDKLTADDILTTRESQYSSTNSLSTHNNESNYNLQGGQGPTVTPPSTPTKMQYDDDLFTGRTPAISADLFQRMRPRRSSIEIDLHSEIRNLRDRVNYLEHENQINSRSCKFFYAIICSYCLMKTFSWLIKNK